MSLLAGDPRELWQKDEGQVVGGQGQGGDGLVAEGQAGLESLLAWASPTWEAHSGELNLIKIFTRPTAFWLDWVFKLQKRKILTQLAPNLFEEWQERDL